MRIEQSMTSSPQEPKKRSLLANLFKRKPQGELLQGIDTPGTPTPESPAQSKRGARTLTDLLRLTRKSAGGAGTGKSFQDSFFLMLAASGSAFEGGLRKNHVTRMALLVWLPILAYSLAGFVAILLDPYMPDLDSQAGAKTARSRLKYSPRTLADDQIIVARNLFSSKGLIPGEDSKGNSDQNNVPVKTSLPLTLVGTLVLRNQLRSVATLQDNSDRVVYPMRVSDEIPGKLKIIQIEANQVIFLNSANGLREYVEIPVKESNTLGISLNRPRPSLDAVAETTLSKNFVIPRAEIDKATENLPLLLTQVLAKEYRESGNFVGFRLTQIQPGSVFAKLGLLDGDVLCGVNGEPVGDVTKAWELFGSLKSAVIVELCIKRNGKENTFNYDLK